jgi:hypothetical protein
MDDAGEHRGLRLLLGHAHARIWLWPLVIVVIVLLALYAHLHPYFRQRAAVRAIEAAGGRVNVILFPHEKNNMLLSPWNGLVKRIFGNQFYSWVADVTIKTDASMQSIGDLKYLLRLELVGNEISDKALECLESCPQIKGIQISDTRITVAGLKRLKLRDLTELSLEGKEVDDQWLAELANNGVLRQLHKMVLYNSSITDKGLSHLKESDQLYSLSIYNASITDIGLEILVEVKELTRISIRNTKVTSDGVKKFHQARPDCRIVLDY